MTYSLRRRCAVPAVLPAQTATQCPVNRGAITLIEAGVYFILAILVIAFAFTQGGSLFNRNDATTEYTNAGDILANARSMLKTNGIYNFSSAAKMTGALIEFGGAPGGMTIVGTRSSGNATLVNLWGGAVTVQPVATGRGQKSSFSLTYNAVPQEACVTLATRLSGSPNIVATKVNGTTTNGVVETSAVGTQCTADSGSAGTNVLTFTSAT
ncbi:prepilin [Enterobacter hormaechei]|nr:prepilin [Enterobacter hormaechei]EKS6646228.1 prepilin [Enterobacter hormaechei]